MSDFLRDKLLIEIDGSWSINEMIAAAIVAVLAIFIVLGLIRLIKAIIRSTNPRRDTIFSHRKNKYKNSIGKKNKY